MTDAALQLHPDRLLPADPTTRGIARRLYASVRDLPIISPHGHVPPEWIAQDVPFGDWPRKKTRSMGRVALQVESSAPIALRRRDRAPTRTC